MSGCRFKIGDEVCVGDMVIGNVIGFTYVETHLMKDWVVDIKTTYFYSNRDGCDISGKDGMTLTFLDGDLEFTPKFLRQKKLDDLGL